MKMELTRGGFASYAHSPFGLSALRANVIVCRANCSNPRPADYKSEDHTFKNI